MILGVSAKHGWVALALTISGSAVAEDARVDDIFNRQNRVLLAPPKSLLANRENFDERLKSEKSRLGRKPGSNSGLPLANENDDDNSDLEEAQMAPMPTVKPIGTGPTRLNVPSPSVQSRSSLSEGTERTKRASTSVARGSRQKSRETYGFSGERVFGLGLIGAGAYGVFGVETDFAVNQELSVGFGLGTGMTYSTWGLYSRFFLKQGARINTFFQVGYANWFLGKAPTGTGQINPNFLTERFFTRNANGVVLESQRAHLIYPGIGVMYQHASGLAASVQLQYMISIKDFSGGLFGAMGLYYYF